MKKSLVLLIFILFLTGCSNGEDNEFTLEGKYVYDECVYVNYFSSSTKDYLAEQYSNVSYIDVESDIVTHFITEELSNQYSDVVFRKTSYEDAIDDVLNLDFDDLNIEIVSIFDIYSNDDFTGLSIIVTEDDLFLVESKFLGNNSSYFIWQIFSLKLGD